MPLLRVSCTPPLRRGPFKTVSALGRRHVTGLCPNIRATETTPEKPKAGVTESEGNTRKGVVSSVCITARCRNTAAWRIVCTDSGDPGPGGVWECQLNSQHDYRCTTGGTGDEPGLEDRPETCTGDFGFRVTDRIKWRSGCKKGEERILHTARIESVQGRMDFSSHHIRLLQQLDEQRKKDLFCDCHIMVEGQVFKAHRNVLFASSGYFKMLLSQSCKDVSKPTTATFDVFSADTFTAILDFVYSGKLPLSGQNVIEVMSAASYLQMTDVITVCKMFIKSSLDINEKDRDGFFSLSDKDNGSNGTGLYAAGWRTENSPTHSHETAEHSGFIAGYNYPPPVNPRLQRPFSKHSRKPEHVRKHRRRLMPEGLNPACITSVPLGDLVGGSAECIVHDEDNTMQDDDLQSHEELLCPKPEEEDEGDTAQSWPDSPQHIDSGDQDGGPRISKADELYKAMPTILGVMSGWSEDDLSPVRFKCPFCTHTVKRKADLKRHLRCHTGERPYPCEACGKRFTRLEHLRNHFQTIHEAGKLICRRCKLPVTEVTGRVIQDGTRRYRLCHPCLSEAGLDNVNFDFGDDQPLVLPPENEREQSWNFKDDPKEENSTDRPESDLVIQEVEDSEEEDSKSRIK